MIDDAFVARFNATGPQRYTKEQIEKMIEDMPNQRVGALFDFIKWMKKTLKQ